MSESHACPRPLRRRWGSYFAVRLRKRHYLWPRRRFRLCHQACHRGPGMSSRDMRLVAAPEEAAGSEWSEPLAWGLWGPFACCGPARPTTTAAYASPPSVGPSCRLLSAASAPWSPGPRDSSKETAGRRATAAGLRRAV